MCEKKGEGYTTNEDDIILCTHRPKSGSLKVGSCTSPNLCNSPFFTRTLILHTTISDP